MSCENKVSFYVQRGYDYSEVFVKCGNTNPHGTRSTCKECSNDVDKMKSIRQHEENVKADNQTLKSAGYGEI